MKEVASFIRSGTPSPHWPAISSDQECLRRWAINDRQEEEVDLSGQNLRSEDVAEQNLSSEDADGPFVCGAAERVSSDLNARCDFIIKNVYQWEPIDRPDESLYSAGSAVIWCDATNLLIALISSKVARWLHQ